jgi:hypothetical protein
MKKNNYNLFEKIRNPEEAYWLGFLTADGSVYKSKWLHANGTTYSSSKIELCLQASDADHLKKFAKFTGIPNKVAQNLPTNHLLGSGIAARRCRFQFSDENTLLNLSKLECGPRKTLRHEFPKRSQVSDKLLNHYLRGYLDGDGSIACKKGTAYKNGQILCNWTVAFAGSWYFINGLGKKLKKIFGKEFSYYMEEREHSQEDIEKPFCVLTVSKGLSIKLLLEYLYENSTEETRMNRKYEKALEALEYSKRIISRQNRLMIFKGPDGEIHKVKNNNAKEFAKKHTISYAQIFSLRTGKSKKSKEGWTCLNVEDWKDSNAMFYNL